MKTKESSIHADLAKESVPKVYQKYTKSTPEVHQKYTRNAPEVHLSGGSSKPLHKIAKRLLTSEI